MLKPNHYNPNYVAPPELKLLKLSILEDGWTQPIVAHSDMTIVDGFHRWTVSGHKEIFELTEGLVPVVVLAEKSIEQRMSATVRHNRARGTHALLKMSDIVVAMLDEGKSNQEIMEHLGMDEEEVLRLANRNGVTVSVEGLDFGASWIPE